VFPQNLKEYLHTSDWNLGVAVTEAGETLVWDQQAHRVVSKLQGLGELEPAPIITDQQGHPTYTIPSAEIQFASFSPDRTRVAIYSGPDDRSKLHVSVWDVESGRKARDFWPEASILPPSGEPLWWNKGRWLLASGPGGKAVWDVITGRFQGSLNLSGCDARESLGQISRITKDSRRRQVSVVGCSYFGESYASSASSCHGRSGASHRMCGRLDQWIESDRGGSIGAERGETGRHGTRRAAAHRGGACLPAGGEYGKYV
jgi:hypothetical protein